MFFWALPELTVEDRLMEQMRKGDSSALKQVYNAYFEALYQFIRPRVSGQAEAEDIVSEVFLKLVQAFRSQKLPTFSLRGWLFRVARNELNDHHRSRNADAQLLNFDDYQFTDESAVDTEYEALKHIDMTAMLSAIQHLTPDQQDVIILRYGQLLSLQETAELLGKKVNAIKILQHRAIHALRRRLDQAEMEVL